MGQFLDVKWPAEFNELTKIEELLHCKICYEYIETCVITPCSHNYCSICIRKFLHYKTQCPICFENIYAKDLHANRILDEFIESYLSLREKLFSCIRGVEIRKRGKEIEIEKVKDEENEDNENIRKLTTPIKKRKNNKFLESKSSHVAETEETEEDNQTYVQNLIRRTPKKLLFQDINKSTKKILNSVDYLTDIKKSHTSIINSNNNNNIDNQILMTPNKKNLPGSSSSSDNCTENTPKMLNLSIATPNTDHKFKRSIIMNKRKVPCPVCNIEISELNINRHLDDCLKRQNVSNSNPRILKNGLEPMPKYVINLMKDSELRKLLKKYGLSTSGTRKNIEKRIQKFSIIYNAERDKLAPKSIEEIVRVCEAEEINERNISKQNSFDNIPNIDRKTDINLIEKYHKQYLQKNKDDFQKLIESINDRERERNKSSNVSLFIPKREESGASTSSASQNSNLSILNRSFDNANETVSSAGGDLSQYFLQDSDSTNTSYPLQHYSRDDPMSYLTLEISTSDSKESPIKFESSFSSKSETCSDWKVKSEVLEESRNYPERLISSNHSSLNSSTDLRIKSESLEDSRNSSTDWRIKSEILEDSRNSFEEEEIIPSNYSAESFENSSIKLSNEIENKEEEEDEKKNVNVSNVDIFDASTEDNCSDYNSSKESRENRAKKCLIKRSKIEKDDKEIDDDRLTDSDTDVETSFKFVGRKMKKLKKRREKNAKKDENGILLASGEKKLAKMMDLDFEKETSSRSANIFVENKENSELNDDDCGKNEVRRSSRKRNLVSYKTNSYNRGSRKTITNMNQGPLNVLENNKSEENVFENETQILKPEEMGVKETNDDDYSPADNETLKSLRKHRKC